MTSGNAAGVWKVSSLAKVHMRLNSAAHPQVFPWLCPSPYPTLGFFIFLAPCILCCSAGPPTTLPGELSLHIGLP